MQLTLFNLPTKITIEYDAKPYDKKGNIINSWQHYTEIRTLGEEKSLIETLKNNPNSYINLKITEQ